MKPDSDGKTSSDGHSANLPALHETTPFHEPREEEEILAAEKGLPTGSREEGPSQQEN